VLVLIAEEDERCREVLAAAARREGHRVVTVADVREAEHALARPGLERVVGDLLVISLASLVCPRAERILVTARAQQLTEDECRQFGIASVLIRDDV
jgi:DNA-binding NtrC family response regulator